MLNYSISILNLVNCTSCYGRDNIMCYFIDIQIDKKLMKAAGMVARVKKEVEIHSRLKHPSILEVGLVNG